MSENRPGGLGDRRTPKGGGFSAYRRHYETPRRSRGVSTDFRIFKDRFKEPNSKSQPPTWIRLVKGAYGPTRDSWLHQWGEHFFRNIGKRGGAVRCSMESEGRCRGCELEQKPARRMSTVNVVHLSKYHKVPVRDNNGEHRKSKGGDLLYNDIPCEGQGCNMCAKPDPEDSTFFGKLCHWSFGFLWYKALETYNNNLWHTCQCGGEIQALGFICPLCETELMEVTPDMTLEKINLYSTTSLVCPHCGEYIYPEKYPQCTDCDDPRPLSIYDVDLKVTKSGEGKATVVNILEHRKSKCPPELLEQELFDLEDIFAPTPYEEQVQILGGPTDPPDENDDNSNEGRYTPWDDD